MWLGKPETWSAGWLGCIKIPLHFLAVWLWVSHFTSLSPTSSAAIFPRVVKGATLCNPLAHSEHLNGSYSDLMREKKVCLELATRQDDSSCLFWRISLKLTAMTESDITRYQTV